MIVSPPTATAFRRLVFEAFMDAQRLWAKATGRLGQRKSERALRVEHGIRRWAGVARHR